MPLNFLNNGYFAGKVGIGAISPTVGLQLGNSILGQTQLAIFNSEGGGEIGLTIQSRTNRAKLRVSDNDSNAYVVAEAGKSFFGTSANGDANNITVLTSGDVGIGTTSPGAKLDVQGTQGQLFSVTDNLSGEIFAVADISGVPIMSVNSSGSIKFGSYSGTNQTGTPTYILGTDASGNVVKVLGADVPGSVSGSGTTNRVTKFTDGPDGVIGDSGIQDASNAIAITINGNEEVGIGSTNPTTGKLVVSSSANQLALETGTAGDGRLNIGHFYNGAFIGTYGDDGGVADLIRFGTHSGDERMRITSAGNVGIGTTSPFGAATNRTCLSVNGTNDVSLNVGTGGNQRAYLYSDGNFARLATIGAIPLQLGVNDSAKMYILDSGNVGIGITSPLAKLQVGLSTSNNGERSTLAMFGAAASGVLNALSLVNTTGAAATGNGTRINFHLSSNYSPTGCIEVVTTDLSVSATDSTMRFKTYGTIGSSVTYVPRLEISPFGAIKFNNYNSTNQTGTPTFLLGTDASGNVVKTNTIPGSGAGPYLPLAGGTMTAGAVVNFLASSGSTDDRLKFGTSGQMQLFHDGSDGYIINSLGDVRMDVNTFRVRSSSGTETMIKATQNDSVELYFNDARKLRTTTEGVFVEGEIKIDAALLDNQQNTDVSGLELVAQVAIGSYTAAFFDFVVKKSTNVRSGTVYACHDGTSVQFTETSTQDLGDTSDVVLSVDISGGQMRLLANAATAAWSVKSLIRAI